MTTDCNLYNSRRLTRFRRRGFTFAEVLAAMVFMGVLIPVILQGLAIANRAGVAAERKTIASRLGNNLLHQYTLSNLWQTAPGSGNFAPEFQNYTWSMQQSGWAQDTMREINLTIFYPVQGQTLQISLSTLVDETQ